MLGYVSPVLNPTSKRQAFLNTIRGITGSTKPVACWLPDTGDGRTSVDPISGRVWVAETLTNLITNGGFETNTTGWTTGGTNSIASSTTQFFFGPHSCLFTYSNNSSYLSYAITVAAAGTYQFSISVFIPSNFDGGGIQLTDGGSFAGGTITVANADMTKTNQWQRLTCQMVIAGGDLVGTLLVNGTGGAPTATRTLFLDGAQMELGAFPTGYIETNGGTATATAPISTRGFGKGGTRAFDGATQYLTTPSTANLSFGNGATDTPFSIFAVINITDTAGVRDIVGKWDATNSHREWLFSISATDFVTGFLEDESAGATPSSTSNSVANQGSWQVYGMTYSDATGGATAGNDISFYDNGVSVATTAANNAAYVAMENAAGDVKIGARSATPAGFFQGQIACVVVVQLNATAAQHLAIYNAVRQYFQF